MIIVDNSLHAFAFHVRCELNIQIENGILIKTFEGERDDKALKELLQTLLKLKDAKDVRVALKKMKK